MVDKYNVQATNCNETREMGQLEELQNSVGKSCIAADPLAQMIGCQSELLTTEIKLVP